MRRFNFTLGAVAIVRGVVSIEAETEKDAEEKLQALLDLGEEVETVWEYEELYKHDIVIRK